MTIPEPPPYVSALLESWGADPDRLVLTAEEQFSARDLRAWFWATASHLAPYFAAQPTSHQQPVGLFFSANSPAWLIARYAVHFFGQPVVHLRSDNARSDERALASSAQARILDLTQCQLVLVDAETHPAAQDLQRARPGLTVLLMPAAGSSAAALSVPQPPPGQTAVFDLTSGSCAQPKIVRHSFSAWQQRLNRSINPAATSRAPRLLVVTPISHTTATMVDAALLAGGQVWLHRGFDSDAVLRSLEEAEISDLYLAVPQLYELVSLLRKNHRGFRPPLREVLYSGTPAAPHRIREAREVFGTALMQLYGSTEAGGISALTPADHAEPELLGTVGRPFSWVELELRDEAGLPVPDGQIGEVCVRSATTMQDYQDPSLPSPWWPQGWLRTGDLGYRTEFGYLCLVSRVGNIVKTAGVKIHPQSVEQQLLTHPLVRQAAVYPVRDAELREFLHAAVEVPGANPETEPELRRYLAEHLSPEHVPHQLTIMARLPRTVTGKIDRSSLP